MGRHFGDHPVHSLHILDVLNRLWMQRNARELLIIHSVVGNASGNLLAHLQVTLSTWFMIGNF